MRITRNQLQDLINEEISNALLRKENRRLLEVAEEAGGIEMSLDDLMDFARTYAGLTRDMRKSLDLILDGSGEGVSTEEIEELQTLVGGRHSELDDYLEDAHEASQMYADEEDDGSWASAIRANR